MTLHLAQSAPQLSPLLRVQLAPGAPGLWRVMAGGGRVIGHLQRVEQDSAVRYRARRLHPASRAFVDLGEFWVADDAVECLVFAR